MKAELKFDETGYPIGFTLKAESDREVCEMGAMRWSMGENLTERPATIHLERASQEFPEIDVVLVIPYKSRLVKLGSKRAWVPMWLWVNVIFRYELYLYSPISWLTYREFKGGK